MQNDKLMRKGILIIEDCEATRERLWIFLKKKKDQKKGSNLI